MDLSTSCKSQFRQNFNFKILLAAFIPIDKMEGFQFLYTVFNIITDLHNMAMAIAESCNKFEDIFQRNYTCGDHIAPPFNDMN